MTHEQAIERLNIFARELLLLAEVLNAKLDDLEVAHKLDVKSLPLEF